MSRVFSTRYRARCGAITVSVLLAGGCGDPKSSSHDGAREDAGQAGNASAAGGERAANSGGQTGGGDDQTLTGGSESRLEGGSAGTGETSPSSPGSELDNGGTDATQPGASGSGGSDHPPSSTGGNSIGGTGTGGASTGGAATGGASSGGSGTEAGGTQEVPDPWVVTEPVTKLDLLLVLDNSQSLNDKQQLLVEALPRLIGNLINPPCVADGQVVAEPATPEDACPTGERRTTPISDLHLGIITSSLGAAGNGFCSQAGSSDSSYSAEMEDMAHLLGSVRSGLRSYQNLGFLAWDNRPEAARDPNATNDVGTLTTDFANMVSATGTRGCGLEAPLEAWYRFLIDPAPYAAIQVDPTTHISTKVGVDETVLAQRAAFLREDSAVAIVMLNDENDCSIRAQGLGNLVSTFFLDERSFQMPRGTTVCEDAPNDPCCISCATASWPGACAPQQELCPEGSVVTAGQDMANLRCFDQKRRFGMDLLEPTSRYVVGLRSPTICPDSNYPDADCKCTRATELGLDCTPGTPVTNPLYANPRLRAPSTVVLLGIVGVPWQDVVSPESLADESSVSLLTPAELRSTVPGQSYSYWDMIVGSPKDYVRPQDPLMVESVEPREGTHPITGEALAAPEAASPLSNPINGHEWNTQERDLQFACIHPLPEPVDCLNADESVRCDCQPLLTLEEGVDPVEEVLVELRPTCQSDDGVYSNVQYRGKAYPSLRQLEVLKDYGDNSIVSSVCPKSLDVSSSSYGYLPAVDALAARLGSLMNR